MPLTIDDFTLPPFGTITVLPGQTKTIPSPPIPPEISFTASPIPPVNYGQPSTLDVRKVSAPPLAGRCTTENNQVPRTLRWWA